MQKKKKGVLFWQNTSGGEDIRRSFGIYRQRSQEPYFRPRGSLCRTTSKYTYSKILRTGSKYSMLLRNYQGVSAGACSASDASRNFLKNVFFLTSVDTM